MTLRALLGPPGALATAVIVLALIAPPAARAEEAEAEGTGQTPFSQSPADSSAGSTMKFADAGKMSGVLEGEPKAA